MKLLLSRPRGFCAGVERAIQIVEKALELFPHPIYVKHHIVHNAHVVQKLKDKGAIFVEEIADVPKGSRIIYSAHGVSPAVRAEAKDRGLIEIDATCGLVTKVHSAVRRFAQKGYKIILIGHKNHVEMIGTQGEAPDVTTIVESLEDVHALTYLQDDKLFYATQTTLSIDDVSLISEALTKRYPQIETLPTSSICYATTNRQMALRSFAGSVDLVLVVGDPTSSNSNRLREVASAFAIPAYLIHDVEEIQVSWLEGVDTLGLTAGASTPEDVVQRCVQGLRALGVSEVEECVYTEEDIVFQLPRSLL